MPIRGLHEYLERKGLYRQDSIGLLRGMRIGVEGFNWLKTLQVREPFQLAMGGIPLTLVPILANELEGFREQDIKPLFVFPGLNLARKEKPTSTWDPRVEKHTRAWDAYNEGRIDEASALFQEERWLATNYVQNVIEYLMQNGVDTFRSPYFAQAQLAYFLNPPKYPSPTIHAVYGSLDLLMYGVPRVITGIDFAAGTFKWIDLYQLLDDLRLSLDQFIDACILAGIPEFAPTFAMLNPVPSAKFDFFAAVKMIHDHSSGHAAITQYASEKKVEKANSLDTYLRARTIIGHHLVFDTNCVCEPRNKEFAPADLHEVVGSRLPDEVYWLLSQGAIRPVVLNQLLSGAVIDGAPLVDSNEYRVLLSDMQGLRTKTLALLSFPLSDFFKKKPVTNVRWYDQSTEINMDHPAHHADVGKLRSRVTDDELRSELARQNATRAGMSFLMRTSQHKSTTGGPLFKAMENLPSDAASDVVVSGDNLIAAILGQALELKEYLTAGTRQPTVWGKALALAEPAFEQEAVVVIDLLRSKLLSGKRLTTTSQRGQSAPYKNEAEVLLLSRVFSLVGMNLKKERPWQGPVDYDLMGFNSLVQSVYKTTRNVLEMLLLQMFLTKRSSVGPEEYVAVALKLPFIQESNTAMGLVLKSFLLEQDTQFWDNCILLRSDIERAISFWDQVMKMVTLLKEEAAISEETFVEFTAANNLLQSHSADLKNL